MSSLSTRIYVNGWILLIKEKHLKDILHFVIKIPKGEFKFTFSRSSGAGGQNVNKLNTRATLSWNIKESSSCSSFVKERFISKYRRFVFEENVIINSQKYRSQGQNIEDCIVKLHKCLESVELAPKNRRATKPSRGSIKKRLDQKAKNSKTKKLRQEKF